MKMEGLDLNDPTPTSSCKHEPSDENVKHSFEDSTHSPAANTSMLQDSVVRTEIFSETDIDPPSATAILRNLLKTGMLSKTYRPSSDASVDVKLENVNVENLSKSKSYSQFTDGANVIESIKDGSLSKSQLQLQRRHGTGAPAGEASSMLATFLKLSQDACRVGQKNGLDKDDVIPSSCGSGSKVTVGAAETTQDNNVGGGNHGTPLGKGMDGNRHLQSQVTKLILYAEAKPLANGDNTIDGNHGNGTPLGKGIDGNRYILVGVAEGPDDRLEPHFNAKNTTIDVISENVSTRQKSQNKECGSSEDIEIHREERLPVHQHFNCHGTGTIPKFNLQPQTHTRTHTEKKPYKYDHCGKYFYLKTALQSAFAFRQMPYKKCEFCGKVFSETSTLQTHVKTHHSGEKPYKCQTCGMFFHKKVNLHIHTRIHTGIKRHRCDTCGKRFFDTGHLKVHLRVHTGEKPYKCETCGKAFSETSTLQTHIKTHSKEKPYNCETCGKAFLTKIYLKKHIKYHTGEKRYRCDTCGKCFFDQSQFKGHMISHSGEKSYLCDSCGKTYFTVSGLRNHMKSHSGERPYKCETCGSSFYIKDCLKSHMRTHMKDKPYEYECKTCGKACYSKGKLYSHMKIHSGEKPHKCIHCGKDFLRINDLYRHIKTHTGEQSRYECPACEKGFSTKSNLQKHMRLHT